MPAPARMPVLVDRFLSWAVPSAMHDEIKGDLEEEANARPAGSRRRLALWYRMQALRIAVRFTLARLGRRTAGVEAARSVGPLRSFGRDLRVGARGLLRRPGFTLVTVATLALGIGVTTAIFSVIYAVLLNPLPYPDADRVVVVWQRNPTRGAEREGAAPGNFLDWRRETTAAFEHLAAISPWGLDYVADGEPESIPALLVSRGYFEALGARPHIGRLLVAEDYAGTDQNVRGRGPQVLVFTYELWQRRFAGDSSVVGRVVRMSDQPYTVVGVLEPGFQSPVYSGREIYSPLHWWPGADEMRLATYLGVVGLVHEGLGHDAAQRALDLVATRLRDAHPRENQGLEIALVPVREQIVGRVQRPLLVLLGAVGTILLIACANIANLLLARGTERRGEFALRVALGADRSRLVRQLLTESLLLAAAGSAAGVVLSHWSARLVLALAPTGIPRLGEAALNLPVAAFAIGITLLTALLIGLVPAWSVTRASVSHTLRESAPGTSGTMSQQRVRGAFTVAQVALAMVLLLGAGLLVRSFRHLLNRELGFDPDRLLALQVYVWNRYPTPESRVAYFEQTLGAVRQAPGVLGAAAAQSPPFHPAYPAASVTREDQAGADGQTARGGIATPGYFGVMGIRLLAGREFAATDGAGAAPVAVVNRTMARRLWGEENPIGRRFVVTTEVGSQALEVVGVAGDFRHQALDDEASSVFFQPHAQNPTGAMVFVVRTVAESPAMRAVVQRAIWSVNANQPFYSVATIEELVSRSVVQRRFAMVLLTAFAVLAAVLAAIGTYGVVSYVAAQRRQEIGIRVAMGARPAQVLWVVSRQGLLWIVTGVIVGLGLAMATSGVLRSLLYEVSPTDPVTVAASAALLLIVAASASTVGALRATRVDPVTALRG